MIYSCWSKFLSTIKNTLTSFCNDHFRRVLGKYKSPNFPKIPTIIRETSLIKFPQA